MFDPSVSLLYWPLMLMAAYLIGSIPFAQVLAKMKSVDLRQVGSGNVGAGNLTSQLGKRWGVAAAILDGLKGLVPVYLARKAGLGLGAAGLVGVAAVTGHNWSLWMRGRSGRGLATSAGMILALNPVLIVWTGGWAVVGWKIGGGVAGFLGWGLLPLVSIALRLPITLTLVLTFLAVILIGRRMQGNLDASHEPSAAMRRAIYDTDDEVGEFPEPVEEPLPP